MERFLLWFWSIVGLIVLTLIGGPILALVVGIVVCLANVWERERKRPWTWEDLRPGITAEVERIKAEDSARAARD